MNNFDEQAGRAPSNQFHKSGQSQNAQEPNLTTFLRAVMSGQTENLGIVELFESQADANPDGVAVICEDQMLTFCDLNTRANQLAHYLILNRSEKDCDTNTGQLWLIGVGVERSLNMVVSILAALKAGGTYVPLDPDYPIARLRYMLTDSRLQTLICSAETASNLLGKQKAERKSLSETEFCMPSQVIDLEGCCKEIQECPTDNLNLPSMLDDASYVIYTSGSTGEPKGVMGAQRGLINRLVWGWKTFPYETGEVCCHRSSINFVDHVAELFSPLLAGVSLLILSKETARDILRILDAVSSHGTQRLLLVPSILSTILKQDDDYIRKMSRVKYWFCSGEALPHHLVASFYQKFPTAHLINIYGSSEVSADVAAYEVVSTEDAVVPIGWPIKNTQIFILNENLQLAVIGEPGEIYVSGDCLALGYLHRNDLTREKFFELELNGLTQRVFKTGDIGRWLNCSAKESNNRTRAPQMQKTHGPIEFLGRVDSQINLRGIRIELSEIEATMCQHNSVQEAIVVPYNPGGAEGQTHDPDLTRLVGYYTRSEQGAETDFAAKSSDLRSWLEAQMPDYMIPAEIIPLESFPLTPNGKIDRLALPSPEQGGKGYVAPSTQSGQRIADIWADLLGLDRVCAHDNFLDIGGNSISGIRFINKMSRESGETFYIYSLFDAPTVEEYDAYLKNNYPQVWSSMNLEVRSSESGAGFDTSGLSEDKAEEIRATLSKRPRRPTLVQAEKPRAAFVLAPPRSGSTLLRVMLGGSPGVFAPPELELMGFDTLQQRAEECSERDTFWLQGAIRAMMELHDCSVDEGRELMKRYEQEGLTTVEFYKVLQNAIGDPLLVDKTAFYPLYAETLRQIEHNFDDPVYIHLQRHPMGAINSFRQARFEQALSGHPYAHPLAKAGNSGEVAEFLWQHSQNNIVEFLEEIPPSRVFRLKFEDLVSKKERALVDLCGFLKVPFDTAMLDPYSDKKDRMTDGVFSGGKMVGDMKFHDHITIDSNAAYRWKQQLENTFLGSKTTSIAKKLGYQTDLDRNSVCQITRQDNPIMSYAQQRIWFLTQLDDGGSAYNISAAFELTGYVNNTALRLALTALVERHESLRMSFPAADGQNTARINPSYDPLSVAGVVSESEIRKVAKGHARTVFDLKNGPLFDVQLIELDNAGAPDNDAGFIDDSQPRHVLLLCVHHLICDGWSLDILYRELRQLYAWFIDKNQEVLVPPGIDTNGKTMPEAALQQQERFPLPVLDEKAIKYSDYSHRQRNSSRGETLNTQLDYWTSRLADAPEFLELPTDFTRPARVTYQGNEFKSVLSSDQTRNIKDIGRRQNVTLFMVLMAAFSLLLSRYSRQKDIVIGSLVANRTHQQTEDLVGLFINTLPFRTNIVEDQTFLDLLETVKNSTLEAFAHQEVPFETLIEALNPPRNLSHSPLFQVMFIMQNARKETLELENVNVDQIEIERDSSIYDLTLSIRDIRTEGSKGTPGHGLECSWEFSSDLFQPETISRMSEYFSALLNEICANPDAKVSSFNPLTEREKQTLSDWNKTEDEFDRNITFLHLFERQAIQTPDRIAVECVGQQLSYRELNEKANNLAHILIDVGVGPEVLSAVLARRCNLFLITILAVFKAGGAYLPLSPRDPADRIHTIVSNSEVPFVLVGEEFQNHVTRALESMSCDKRPSVLSLEDLFESGSNAHNPQIGNVPNSLAYVIYTSGSTGLPKGAMVEHKGMINHFRAKIVDLDLNGDDRVVQNAPQTFDISVWQFLAALVLGARVHICSDEVSSDPVALLRDVKMHKLSILEVVPSLLRMMLDELDTRSRSEFELPFLRWLVPTGEALPPSLCKKWLTAYPNVPILNAYGPTECSDDVAHYKVEKISDSEAVRIPIGSPILNTQFHVLNPQLQPVPIGVPGELYVSGVCVGRGYLNDLQKTEATFIANPFNSGSHDRLYKTGDLVRFLSDGTLDFLGRVDKQVKVRGFRIELAEIETVLNQHGAVEEAVIVLNTSSAMSELLGPPLVAFVTTNEQLVSANTTLRIWLKERLPDYMVPSSIIVLDTLPLTPNGKIDQKSLTAMDVDEDLEDYEAPRSSNELQLLHIFQEVLGLQKIGVGDNFFDLGGHSLVALRLVSGIEQQFGWRVPLAMIFQNPTIKQLAVLLRETLQSTWSPIVKIQPLGSKPPLFIVHPVGGNVLCYFDLSKSLGSERPLFGLQSIGMEPGQKPFTSIRQIAKFYVDAIREIQPAGPYNLTGWSFGGAVAFEMALQLQNEGEAIQTLSVIDLMSPSKIDISSVPNDNIAFLLDLFAIEGSTPDIERLCHIPPAAQLSSALENKSEFNLLPADIDIEYINRLAHVFYTNRNAIADYEPGVFEGEILLFIAANNSARKAEYDDDLNWSEHTTDGVQSIMLSADHYSIIKQPNVAIIAEALKQKLET